MENNILNELRTPVFLVNNSNDIIYINEICEEFFGVSSNIIVGKKKLDITDEIIKLLNNKSQKLDF